jgi:hypothetical protein
MKQMKIQALAALAVCSLAATPAHADESIDAWPPLAAHELAARRGGLRIGGLDVSVDVWLRDSVDGAELPAGSSVFQLEELGGLSVLAQLVNRVDGVRIQRDTEIRVRIDGFTSVFGSSALRTARTRVRNAFE